MSQSAVDLQNRFGIAFFFSLGVGVGCMIKRRAAMSRPEEELLDPPSHT